MEEKLTAEEVIQHTITTLENIRVPVSMKKDIADPIAVSINNLQLILNAIEEQKAKQESEETVEEVIEDGTGTDE